MVWILNAEYVEDYKIHVTFNNDESGIIDLKEVILIVLTGFIKKTQKLPKKELKRAKEYLQQFKQMEGE